MNPSDVTRELQKCYWCAGFCNDVERWRCPSCDLHFSTIEEIPTDEKDRRYCPWCKIRLDISPALS